MIFYLGDAFSKTFLSMHIKQKSGLMTAFPMEAKCFHYV